MHLQPEHQAILAALYEFAANRHDDLHSLHVFGDSSEACQLFRICWYDRNSKNVRTKLHDVSFRLNGKHEYYLLSVLNGGDVQYLSAKESRQQKLILPTSEIFDLFKNEQV